MRVDPGDLCIKDRLAGRVQPPLGFPLPCVWSPDIRIAITCIQRKNKVCVFRNDELRDGASIGGGIGFREREDGVLLRSANSFNICVPRRKDIEAWTYCLTIKGIGVYLR